MSHSTPCSGGNEADTFVFARVFGTNVVTDFELGTYIPRPGSGLMGEETETPVIVTTYASVTGSRFGGAQVEFNFGNGRVIILDGLTTLEALAERLEVI